MSKKGEFGEPWSFRRQADRRGCWMVEGPSGSPQAWDMDKEPNAARIVSCVNALNGLEPEKLGALIEAAKKLAEDWPTPSADLRSALDELGVPRG